ncbi:MAG: ATP-binding cassette domain-containing protein, partial [Proteobacteria bacterium]
VGIVFQQFHLIPYLTAFENVELPTLWESSAHGPDMAKKLLEQVGLSSRVGHFPAQLSGGEKQRVAIARALVNRPGLVLADEPSGNLDEETGNQVMDLLFEQCSQLGSSLVLVTHDQDLAKRCDQVWTLEHGLFR